MITQPFAVQSEPAPRINIDKLRKQCCARKPDIAEAAQQITSARRGKIGW
jgi:hypothetical protein